MRRANRDERTALLEQRIANYRLKVQDLEDDIRIVSATSADEDDYDEAINKLKEQRDQLVRAGTEAEAMLAEVKRGSKPKPPKRKKR